jgi:hypothetical protein
MTPLYFRKNFRVYFRIEEMKNLPATRVALEIRHALGFGTPQVEPRPAREYRALPRVHPGFPLPPR